MTTAAVPRIKQIQDFNERRNSTDLMQNFVLNFQIAFSDQLNQ
jgi:hypothetical protein